MATSSRVTVPIASDHEAYPVRTLCFAVPEVHSNSIGQALPRRISGSANRFSPFAEVSPSGYVVGSLEVV